MSTYARQAAETLAAVLGLGGADVPQATQIEAAIDQAMGAERERCAKACIDDTCAELCHHNRCARSKQLAARIRSLGPAPSETPPTEAKPSPFCPKCKRISATRETRTNPNSFKGRARCWSAVLTTNWAYEDCATAAAAETPLGGET